MRSNFGGRPGAAATAPPARAQPPPTPAKTARGRSSRLPRSSSTRATGWSRRGGDLLAELAWLRGRRDLVAQHRESAVALVAEGASPTRLTSSPPPAALAVHRSSTRPPCVPVSRRTRWPISWASTTFGHTRIITIGTSRALSGDLEGVADLEQAIAVAREANSPQPSRGSTTSPVRPCAPQLFDSSSATKRPGGAASVTGSRCAGSPVSASSRTTGEASGTETLARQHRPAPGGFRRRRLAQPESIRSRLCQDSPRLPRMLPCGDDRSSSRCRSCRGSRRRAESFPALAVGAHIASSVQTSRAPACDELLEGDAGRASLLPSVARGSCCFLSRLIGIEFRSSGAGVSLALFDRVPPAAAGCRRA